MGAAEGWGWLRFDAIFARRLMLAIVEAKQEETASGEHGAREGKKRKS